MKDDVKQIVSVYKIIYYIIFVAGLPALAFTISLFLLFSMQGDVSAEREAFRTDEIILQENINIDKFYSFLDEGGTIEGLDVIVKNGLLDISTGSIYSVDNLLTYNGLVFPREVSISRQLPIQSRDYFLQKTYSLRDLQRYLDNSIFTTREVEYTKEERTLLSFKGLGLIEYFNLTCVSAQKIYPAICNAFVDEFLRVFYIYDLSEDYEGLLKIFEGTKGDLNVNKKFCDGILRYMRYTDDTHSTLGVIASICGENYHATYDMYTSFINIQNDLLGPASSQYVYANRQVNAYKLLSIQQKIYHELLNRRFNQTRIEYYLKFVEELLKKDVLDKYYIDVIYLFNNDHLLKQLLSPQIASIVPNNDSIRDLTDGIRKVNRGNELVGYEGLQKQIYGLELQGIVAQELENDLDIATQGGLVAGNLLDRFNSRFVFPSLAIFNKTLSGTNNDEISVFGKLTIRGPDIRPISLDVDLIFIDKAGRFVIKYINFESSENLSNILNQIAQTNTLSMSQMYEYIVSNITIFLNEEEGLGLCDLASDQIENLEFCSGTGIVVSNTFEDKKYLYTFVHDEGILNRILINDPEIEQNILREFDLTKTNETDILLYIQEVLAYKPPVVVEKTFIDRDETLESDRLQIASTFSSLLGSTPESIMTKDGITLVVFRLNKIKFVAQYDVTTKSIDRLFFSDIGPRFVFVDLNFSLDQKNIDRIDYFTIETLRFLEEYNAEIVRIFLEKNGRDRSYFTNS